MAMNKYMHPRNIYKSPPNFKQLAIEFPEFRKHVKQELTGKVSIDFKDVNALRALSCTLLKKDFGLDVEIPPNKLIPTIPLRLNYLLWIEDLMNITHSENQIKGIDIGTGAACVYPLVAAKKFGWSMIATEINDDSIESAKKNIDRNDLQNFIQVKKVVDEALISEVVKSANENFDFCMCNPPFFSSSQELQPNFKSRNINRPKPRNAFCANVNEVVAQGGEVEFITKLIHESCALQTKIRIYTTMVGHKSSLPPLKKLLREVNVVSFKQTEFCQGFTTRWGLAWTFSEIDLRTVPKETLAAAKKEKLKPMAYCLPEESKELTIEEINKQIINITKELLISFEEIKHSKNLIAYSITANQNTWSNQRQKRRAQKRLESLIDTEKSDITSNNNIEKTDVGAEFENAANRFAELNVAGSAKRIMDESDIDEYFQSKKLKGDTQPENTPSFFLKAFMSIRNEGGKYLFEMSWIEGTTGKDAVHQILQYIKNNLKLGKPEST